MRSSVFFGKMTSDTTNRRKGREVLLTALLLAFFLCLGTAGAFGAQQGYELKNYDYTADVHKDHSLDVTQKLTVNVPEDTSEITVYVAKGSYRVTDIRVKGSESVVTSEDNDLAVKVTIPKSAAGKDYVIDLRYKVAYFKDYNSSYDRLYFDALSSAWKVPISQVNIKVNLPSDFPEKDLQMFAGQFGTQDTTNKAVFQVQGHTVNITAQKVPANFGITLKAQLPNGYWKGALDYGWVANLSALVFAVILLMTLLLWLIGGRDPRMKKSRYAYPPKGMMPMEVSYLDNGRFKTRDVVALLIYMGIRGYLRIQEYAPKQYRIYKLKEPSVHEEKYVRSAFDIIFRDVYEGRAVEMEDLGSRLSAAFSEIRIDIESGYTSKDMKSRTTLSRAFRIISMIMLGLGTGSVIILSTLYAYTDNRYAAPLVVALLSIATIYMVCTSYDNRKELETLWYRVRMGVSLACFAGVTVYSAYMLWQDLNSPLMPLLIVAMSFVCLWLTVLMSARARGNAAMNSKVDGLRRFINTASEKEISHILREDPYYYYKILPYAYQFSMMEKWAKKFQYMDIKPPSWYDFNLSGHAQTDRMMKKGTVSFAFSLISFARTIISEYDGMVNRGRRIRFR